ncbi:hypothetical protein BLAT2472_10139 [Burkholderia latens]
MMFVRPFLFSDRVFGTRSDVRNVCTLLPRRRRPLHCLAFTLDGARDPALDDLERCQHDAALPFALVTPASRAAPHRLGR